MNISEAKQFVEAEYLGDEDESEWIVELTALHAALSAATSIVEIVKIAELFGVDTEALF